MIHRHGKSLCLGGEQFMWSRESNGQILLGPLQFRPQVENCIFTATPYKKFPECLWVYTMTLWLRYETKWPGLFTIMFFFQVQGGWVFFMRHYSYEYPLHSCGHESLLCDYLIFLWMKKTDPKCTPRKINLYLLTNDPVQALPDVSLDLHRF